MRFPPKKRSNRCALYYFNPIFNRSWSPLKNLSQHCSTKPSPKTSSSTACWLGTLSTEWVIACMQTAQTNCIRVQKHIKLYNNPTPLEFNQATPNAYPRACATTWHPARRNPSLIWGRHWALKDRGSPGTKTQRICTLAQKHSLYNNPTPWNLTRLPKCITNDSPVSVQQHDTQPYSTPP